MIEGDDDAEQFDCATMVRARNGARAIVMKDKIKTLEGIDDRVLSRLANLIELWLSGRRLHEKQFRKLRDVGGGSSRSIFEFKSSDSRLFGFVCNLVGKKTFVVADVDPAKKTTKSKSKNSRSMCSTNY